ncbi:MAG: DUF4249 domain-containing protein [Bacteroidota bacterium]
MQSIYRFSILFLLLLAGFVSGCEDVIDVDLNEADPRLVVEAYLTNEVGSAEVTLSRTTSYFEEQSAQVVIGATVTIRDGNGNIFPLDELTAGKYTNSTLQGQPGESYTLEIATGQENVTATAEMPGLVPIDSLDTQVVQFPIGGQEDLIVVRCHYVDPAGQLNFYRPLLAINGTLTTDIAVYDDRSNDGIATAVPLFSDALETGDSVRVDLWSIDRTNYYYYNGLADNLGSGNGGSAAPGNPDNNLSGDVLGVFTVAASSSASIVISD